MFILSFFLFELYADEQSTTTIAVHNAEQWADVISRLAGWSPTTNSVHGQQLPMDQRSVSSESANYRAH